LVLVSLLISNLNAPSPLVPWQAEHFWSQATLPKASKLPEELELDDELLEDEVDELEEELLEEELLELDDELLELEDELLELPVSSPGEPPQPTSAKPNTPVKPTTFKRCTAGSTRPNAESPRITMSSPKIYCF
jgi:hypothetical protein